jgi:predicted O-methyltransferase YrrM
MESNVSDLIRELVVDIPGWTPHDQLLTLFTLASQVSEGQGILEIGTWCGKSANVLALAAKQKKNVKLSCVDLFPELNDWIENSDGSHSIRATDGTIHLKDHPLFEEPFVSEVLPIYKNEMSPMKWLEGSLNHNNLRMYVEIFKGDVSDFAKNLSGNSKKYGLVFIDADHSFQSVCKDIEFAEKVLVSGGWLCLDDANTVYTGVDEAISKMITSKPNIYNNVIQVTRKMLIAQKI